MSEPVPPWGADCELDEEIVRDVLREQFSQLAPWNVRFLKQGWDSRVYLVNDQWIFRMPKRAEVVPTLMMERQLLPLLHEALPVEVPRFRWHGVPSDRYPHPFSGYRLLEGDLADAVPRRELVTPDGARRLGKLLRIIHAFPIERARAAGVPEGRELDLPAVWLRDALDESAGEIESVLGEDRWRALQPLLASDVACGRPSFRHADLDLGHLLLARETRAVTGVIDWADTNLGDPAIDFAAFEMRCGDDFVAGMLGAYEPEDPAAFHDRIRDLAKRLSVVWIAETLRIDPENLPGLLRDFDRIYGTRDV